MDNVIFREIWPRAASRHADDFSTTLSELLDGYVRRPGKDELVRVTTECIGRGAYMSLLAALSAKARRHVWYHDYGWHVALRSRLLVYMSRRLQRELVLSGGATDVIAEDLLAYDVGV